MPHEWQGKMADILDSQPDLTMPCKGLQVLGLQDEESRCCQMKMPVEHYQHAKECQASMGR
jgi:hypothetical protein